MICFPGAKINLGLNIVEKRADGFHNIETVFYPIPWCDALEAVENKQYKAKDKKLQLHVSGNSIEGKTEDNIISKTYQLLDENYRLPPLLVHLHKVIPMGAGLGGGSSDGAFFIKLLNEKLNLNLNLVQQLNYAKQLGSDCAFFIENKPVFATGKGDVFTPIDLNLSWYCIVVIYPNINSNTARAYKEVIPAKSINNIQSIISSGIKIWKKGLFNDFEKPIFAGYPELEKIKGSLYAQGALYAAMSGSGSAVYGIFEKDVDIKELVLSRNYKIWKSKRD